MDGPSRVCCGRIGSGMKKLPTMLGIMPLLAALHAPMEPASAQPAPCGPAFSRTGPDAEAYGIARGYPLGTAAARNRPIFMVASYSRFDQLFPVHAVPAGDAPSPLKRDCAPMSISYRHDG